MLFKNKFLIPFALLFFPIWLGMGQSTTSVKNPHSTAGLDIRNNLIKDSIVFYNDSLAFFNLQLLHNQETIKEQLTRLEKLVKRLNSKKVLYIKK